MTAGLIDTHTHLESFARRGTLDAVLTNARQHGLETLITVGTSDEDWELYRGLAATSAGFVRYTVGLHPCSVDETWPTQVSQIEAFFAPDAATPNVRPVALGECGLDRFHLPKTDPAAGKRIFAWQREAFRAQLTLARRLAVPVVVHSRGAFTECVEEIDASGVAWERVVFHCFAEGEAEMRTLRERGGYGSFTGILTYKSADAVRAAARCQGLNHLMLETDAPYLTPLPHRGKPNEPAYLHHTASFAADLFGTTLANLAAHTTRTARRFFQLEN